MFCEVFLAESMPDTKDVFLKGKLAYLELSGESAVYILHAGGIPRVQNAQEMSRQ
jgi:hypothetical protein